MFDASQIKSIFHNLRFVRLIQVLDFFSGHDFVVPLLLERLVVEFAELVDSRSTGFAHNSDGFDQKQGGLVPGGFGFAQKPDGSEFG